MSVGTIGIKLKFKTKPLKSNIFTIVINAEFLFYIILGTPKEKLQTRREVARAKKLSLFANVSSRSYFKRSTRPFKILPLAVAASFRESSEKFTETF